MTCASAGDDALRRIRGNEIAMIFQEPMTSLNPVFTIGNQIAETLMLHQGLNQAQAREQAFALLELVRLPDAQRLLDAYPHTLSGGMRQRAMIAMALSCKPALLIADEPTTALDVTIQAQILNIIRELQRDLNTAVLFITHDMGVVAQMADDVVVMWRGRQVEHGPVERIFHAPQHPYTRALLSAVPRLGSLNGQKLPKRMPLTVLDDGQLREVGTEQVQDTVDASAPLLTVDKLTTRFDVGHTLLGRVTHRVHAVEEVSFEIYPGETLALVGESGSGKSTIGKTLQQLVEATSGSVRFAGQDVSALDRAGSPAVAPGDPVHLPGPLRLARPAQDRRLQHRRADPAPMVCSPALRPCSAGSRNCSSAWACSRSTCNAIRTSSRAASGSASASRGRWPATPSW